MQAVFFPAKISLAIAATADLLEGAEYLRQSTTSLPSMALVLDTVFLRNTLAQAVIVLVFLFEGRFRDVSLPYLSW